MGCCCSQEAMPLYDDEPPTRFDVVLDDLDDVACAPKAHTTGGAGASTRGIGRPLLDANALGNTTPMGGETPAMYSPAETINPDSLTGRASAAPHAPADFQLYDMFSTTSDPHRDIDRAAVDLFVQSLNPAMLEDTFAPVDVGGGGGGGGAGVPPGAFGATQRGGPQLSAVQLSFIDSGETPLERVRRLQMVEAERRSDIANAMSITVRMLELGLKRVYPTIRSRVIDTRAAHPAQQPSSARSASGASSCAADELAATTHVDPNSTAESLRPPPRPRRPVVIIHHRDLCVSNDTFAAFGAEPEPPLPAATDADAAQLVRAESESGHRNAESPLLDGRRKGASRERRSKSGELPDALKTVSFSGVPSAAPNAAGALDVAEPPETIDGANTSVGAAGTHMETMEILELTAMDIPLGFKTKCTYIDATWDFLSLPGAQKVLNRGDGFFRFKSCPLTRAAPEDLDLARMFLNVTCFRDEERENNVPFIDLNNPEHLNKYTAIWVKAMYLFPGVKLSNITAELLATVDYQHNCQPGNPKVFDDVTEPLTFRSQKAVIRFVFSVVVQMRCSEITDPAVLQTFRAFDGIVPSKILVMERTKRDIRKRDSTEKCKSFLIFYPITGGLLVSHQTVLINTAIPKVVSSIMSNFASSGAQEAADTAILTRKYLVEKFGDSRRN